MSDATTGAAGSLTGTVLSGRYRLESKLGSGGMSTVYLARDETLERWVAVKVLHREISDQPDQLERFRREARAVAQLSHPNVVAVIDAGEDGGRPYIVFEYVEGETLKQRIDRLGGLPLDEAAAYAIEVGRGLAAAHARRLVHRDVKPQNVLIDAEGRAKVTDFGIARALEQDGLDEDRARARHDRLRLARAGDGPGGRRPLRHLLARDRALRDADRRGPVQGGQPGRRGDEARQREDARRPEAPPRGLLGARRGGRAGDREGARQALLGHERDARATSRTRSRSRSRAAGRSTGEATTVLDSVPAPPAPGAVTAGLDRGHPARPCGDGGGARDRGVDGGGDKQRENTSGGGNPPPAGAEVELTEAQDFDPEGGDGEHPDEVKLAIDGIPNTTWQTETYTAGPDLSLSGKDGVGLIVEAAEPVEGQSITVGTTQGGWSAEIYAADSGPPTDLAGWGEPIGSTTNADDQEQIALTPNGAAKYYLIWFTQLAEADDGGRVEVSDVALNGA